MRGFFTLTVVYIPDLTAELRKWNLVGFQQMICRRIRTHFLSRPFFATQHSVRTLLTCIICCLGIDLYLNSCATHVTETFVRIKLF